MSATLIDSLELVRHRVRRLSALLGTGLIVASSAALLLATVAVDYMLNVPALPRLGLVLLSVAAGLYAAWHWVARALLAGPSLADVAGRVERAYPQFQDGLRSTVDILRDGSMPGSEVMKQRVVAEASRRAQTLDLGRVVTVRPVCYAVAAGIAAVCLVVSVGRLAGPAYAETALWRLAVPFADHPWPKRVNIDLVGAEPDRIATGQRLDVSVRLSRGDGAGRRAVIHYQYGDPAGDHFGPEEQEFMTRGSDGVYRATVDARTLADAAAGQVRVWVECGDDRRDLRPVAVVPRLAIRHVEALVTPPSYADLPPYRLDVSRGPAEVVVGSTVRLTVTFNKPLDPARPVSAEPLTPKSPAPVRWDAPAGHAAIGVAVGTVDALSSTRFRVHATDVDGLTNTAAEEYEVVVRPDRNPTVSIENPRRNEDRTPQAVIPLRALAEDDFGISSLTLVVDRVADKKRWTIPLIEHAAPLAGTAWERAEGDADLRRFRAKYGWGLTDLGDGGVRPGDVLEYHVDATDNYRLNGAVHPPASSEKLRVTVISQDDLTRRMGDELTVIAAQVGTIKSAQTTVWKQTGTLARGLRGKPAMDDADRAAADRLSGQQGTIAAQAKSVAGALSDLVGELDEDRSAALDVKQTAQDVADLLNGAAQTPMTRAASGIAGAGQTVPAGARDQTLADAQDAQAQAADLLQKAIDRVGNAGGLARDIDALQAILDQQVAVSASTAELGKAVLGKTAEQMSPADRAGLAGVAASQAALADRTAKAIDGLGRDAGKAAKSDPTAAQAMTRAADAGQQQDVAGHQRTASEAAGANQQARAQSDQRQAEQGLQSMLSNLRDAQKHKLDELAKKLAELQQQLAVLIRRQAGHNLDTVASQGGDALAKLDLAARDDLVVAAGRDPQAPPAAADPESLGTAQEQTERNTRDVATASQDLSEAGQAADHLTRAADDMARAVVYLRDDKPASAYDPAQVEALGELRQAKRLVDEQKKQADDKKDAQGKEAIQRALVALRDRQAVINAKTVAIDASPRTDDGSLGRVQRVGLVQLSAEQRAVASDAGRLDPALAALGSIAYAWANHDLVQNMTQVADLLDGAQPGGATRAQQEQVIAELDAMIRDLKPDPKKKKEFEKREKPKGGGGAGGGAPTMPSEAELRLVRDLQLAENLATVTVGKRPDAPRSDLVALGDRQGKLRQLLDACLQKATKGKSRLPPERPERDALPEESGGDATTVAEKVDNAELDNELLGTPKPKPKPANPTTRPGKSKGGSVRPGAEDTSSDLAVLGDRMARSRQRLSNHGDAGPITQEVQKRIVGDLDDLIEMARQEDSPPPKPSEDGQKADGPKSGADAAPQDTGGTGKKEAKGTAAANASGGGGAAAGDPAADIARQAARTWGDVTPRQRQAVIESQSDQVLDKYKDLVDDYYRTLSTQAKP